MQPAPLAGSETMGVSRVCYVRKMQPAPLAGSETFFAAERLTAALMQPAPLAGSETNIKDFCVGFPRCNPRPSRGRKRKVFLVQIALDHDATRAPRGVGNMVGML